MKKIKIFLIAIGILILTSGVVEPQQQRVLRVCQASTAPNTLDPHMHHNIEIEDILRQICEHLVDRDANGKLIPSLATSWSLMNDTTWQFTLRKGVTFHNGEEFNAKAVKSSIERILDPIRKSPQNNLYNSIDHVDIIDKYIVNIITKTIDVVLPAKLSLFANIVPSGTSDQRDDTEFATRPIGTGPFRFLERGREKEIVLIPNDNYWGKVPKIDKLVFYFIADADSQIKMIMNGELDVVSNILPKYSLSLKKHANTTIVKRPTTQFVTLRLNTVREGPFNNLKLRKALSQAIDTEKLIKYLYNGNGIPLATVTMPEEFGFNPHLRPYTFDLTKAQAMLFESGVPRNRFSMLLLTFEDLEPVGIAVKHQIERMGIETKIKLISRGEFINQITTRSIDFDGVIGNPTDPYFDASFQLDLMFNSKSSFSRYRNREVDELLMKASQTIDESERRNILMKIQDIIYREVPNVFSFQNVRIYGLRRDISNFVPYADGLLRVNTIERR